MRTVEKNIINEILYGYCNGQKNINFSCRDRVVKNDSGDFKVYLWENLIFWKLSETNKYYFWMHGWNSQTTKNRINAFISGLAGKDAHIYTKDQQLYYSSNNVNYHIKIDASKCYEIQGNGELKEVKNTMNVL